LGDDLVIADAKVAKKYILLCKIYGIPINLSKSLLSFKGNALEFAKRTYYKGNDVSAITLKEYWMAHLNIAMLAMLAKDYKLTLSRFLSTLGTGYRSKANWLRVFVTMKPSRLRDRLIMYSSPFVMGPPVDLESYFSMKSVTEFTKNKVGALWNELGGYSFHPRISLPIGDILYMEIHKRIAQIKDALAFSKVDLIHYLLQHELCFKNRGVPKLKGLDERLAFYMTFHFTERLEEDLLQLEECLVRLAGHVEGSISFAE